MATINLEVNEEWLRTAIAAALAGQPSLIITSNDGAGCPLGWHIVVTGEITRERITVNVALE